jgi:type II pantothenate kinase
MQAAIDFGITNTDAVGSTHGALHYWTRPSVPQPDRSFIRSVLAEGGIDLAALPRVAVTGGRHKSLPAAFGACEVVGVPEVSAIGRGGQALTFAPGDDPTAPLLVVSAGSGTAVVAARGQEYAHVTGTGVGGGTLLGLGRLLLHTTDGAQIDAMAMRGDPNGADLALRDVVSGPIGSLPQDATAVNFGRIARLDSVARPDDLAAALMTLVAQVIAVTAINAARAERIARVVIIGHMGDFPSFRRAVALVGTIYGVELHMHERAGYGTALGALLHGEPLDAMP